MADAKRNENENLNENYEYDEESTSGLRILNPDMINTHEHFFEDFFDRRDILKSDIAIDELLLFNLAVNYRINELIDRIGIRFREASG